MPSFFRSSHFALIGLLMTVAALCIASVREDSATVDEPAHIAAGMIKLSTGWLQFYPGQLPLMNSLSATPLLVAGYRMPHGWQSEAEEWSVGRKFIYRSGYDAGRILFLARLPTIALFLGLSIAVYVCVLQQTGSGWWALAAAILTGFCPNLMAHGRLATVDSGLTFFAFTAAAALLRLIDKPSLASAIVFGLSSAAAMMTKVSGLLLGPYCLAIVAGAVLLRRIQNRALFWRRFLAGVAVGFLFFEAFMLAEMSRRYRLQYPSVPYLLVPFADYRENVRVIRDFYSRGYDLPQFLLGHLSRNGWPQYYVVAFALKTPLPAIALFVIGAMAGARRRSFAVLALLTFVLLFVAVASAGHLDLGIRYVLPIYPFAYAAAAIGLSTLVANAGTRTRPLTMAIMALMTWHIAENVFAHPSYISYFNELAGGRANADKFLADSNLDWGQDLRRLDRWCGEQKIRRITVQYFGGAEIEYDVRSAKPLGWSEPSMPLPKGYFAVSRHLYRVSKALWGVDYDGYLASNHARFVTSIGGSMNVYRVE